MERIRVASVQYNLRPVASFQEFAEQVTALVATAADYGAQLVVLPEYFTVQLLHLADIRRPIDLQVRDLARNVPEYMALVGGLARKHGTYIVGGTIPTLEEGSADVVHNVSYVFGPAGGHVAQAKIHTTRWESDEWRISPGTRLKIIDTEIGRMAVTICYDVEFPELARAAARAGALMLICPSCTDDRQGYLRVRYCAQARAIENQIYVVHSCTVGSLPQVPAVSLNYGAASILTPSDFAFSRDGILREGNINDEMMVIGDLNLRVLEESRTSGSVLPLRDSQSSSEVARNLDTVSL